MLTEEVKVQTKGHPEASFTYTFSESVEEAVTMYEANNVHELFKRALTIAAQANARKMLAQGYTAERIQIEMAQWKPGVSLSTRSTVKTVDPVKVITENFDDWTPERQEEIFKLIQERFASRGQVVPTASPDANGSPTPPDEPTEEEIAAITAGVNGDTQEAAPAEPVAEASADPAGEYSSARRRR